MARATATIKQIQFVIEGELTEAYVFVEADGDAPIGVQGWHHKTFPASMSVKDILERPLAPDYLM